MIRVEYNLETGESVEVQVTEAEISSAQAAEAARIASIPYVIKRAAEYPPIGDQLDALFHAGAFPAEMAARIQAVKDRYPK